MLMNNVLRCASSGLFWLALCGGLCVAVTARSEATVAVAGPSSPEVLGRLAAGGGLPSIAVGREGEQLWAATCRGACDWQHAVALDPPPAVARTITKQAIATLRIGAGKKVLHVTAPPGLEPWQAVLAPPPHGDAPTVVYASVSGWTAGNPGERTGTAVELYENARGETDVVVGELREDVQLCGRSTLLSPKLLYAPEMRLRAVRLQRLPQAERDGAPRLSATENDAAVEHPLLKAVAASSGAASPLALTDGDPSSSWAEQRGGDGSGEFVVMRATAELPISEVHLRIRPTVVSREQGSAEQGVEQTPVNDTPTPVPSASAPSDGAVPGGAAPKELWLATDASLYHVTFPVDAWTQEAGKVYSVKLPRAVTTGCLAVVLESAYVPERADAEYQPSVTLAEVSARALVSEPRVRAAVAALGGADEPAEAASHWLAALGRAAYEPLLEGFVKLPEAGRRRALELLEAAPCALSARAFAVVVDGKGGALEERGVSALRRCADEVEPQLAEIVAHTKGARLRILGSLLLERSPATTVDVAVKRLDAAGPSVRADLRDLIARGIEHPEGEVVARRWLAAPELRPRATIDLLRALGDRVVAFQPHAGQRARALLAGEPSFRTRYLLAAPLAHLAQRDARAASVLMRLLTGDREPAVRTEAARVALSGASLTPVLLRAAQDEHVRVREAAVTSLGEQKVAAAIPTLLKHLERDPWPMVRAASVRALRQLPPTPDVLSTLADTAELDVSPEVRRPAVLALGLLGGQAHVEVVRELYDGDPDPHVQAAAAAALGQLCDAEMVGELTSSALKLTRLGGSERDAIVGQASLAALGRLNPPDLKRRLSPFGSPEVPVIARRAAELALSHPDPCKR